MTKTEIYKATRDLIQKKQFLTSPMDEEQIELMYFAYRVALSDLLSVLKIKPSRRLLNEEKK